MTATEASASIQNAANPMEMKCINTIRTLSMDAVQAANSGHPGTPMSMAPLAYCYGRNFCATIQRTRTGPTATASFFPPARIHAVVFGVAPRRSQAGGEESRNSRCACRSA